MGWQVLMSTGFYKFLGFLLVGLAALGFVLPVLPGTPFLLGAAWCFARSSEKWHRWLLESDLFGPVIRNWEERRCISLRTKIVALSSMVLVGGTSVIFGVEVTWLRVVAIILMAVGSVAVLSLETCQDCRKEADDAPAA